MKFKVGDKVFWKKEIDTGTAYFAIIKAININTHEYIYDIYNRDFSIHTNKFSYNIAGFEEEVEFNRVKDTKIARTVHKNKIDKIQDGWIYLNGN